MGWHLHSMCKALGSIPRGRRDRDRDRENQH